KSKVVAISGKDRSSIGLAGQFGTAYLYSAETGRFITSDYYMSGYPEWWKAFYANKPQNKYFGQSWTPLLPDDAYARSVPTIDPGPSTTRDQAPASRLRAPATPRSRIPPITIGPCGRRSATFSHLISLRRRSRARISATIPLALPTF